MAHILQDNEVIKEMYVCNDKSVKEAKLILTIYENGKLILKWCYEDIVEIQKEPTLSMVGRKMRLEYGEPNLFMQREIMPFSDENGKLEKIWEKIV